ncbi:hypothetical protein [Nocardioides sp.]|uniref:hypothetical protein n=1 Tax=Nocardioides sp. TaxID=35761 RepID=UPI0035273C5B
MAARRSSVVGALVALAVASVALLVALGGRAADRPPQPERSPEPAPAAVLAAWDGQRADAWGRGDLDGLARLYTDGSPAGRHDRRMLHHYLARGLRVEGLRMQRLRVVVVEQAADRWVLEVCDRVAGGTIVGRGVVRPLPRDRVSAHRVTLLRVDGRWRVSEVLAVGGAVSPARPR